MNDDPSENNPLKMATSFCFIPIGTFICQYPDLLSWLAHCVSCPKCWAGSCVYLFSKMEFTKWHNRAALCHVALPSSMQEAFKCLPGWECCSLGPINSPDRNGNSFHFVGWLGYTLVKLYP